MAFNPLPDIPPPVQLSEMDGTFSQSGVYFLWLSGAVVYVGQAKDMTKRVLQHMVDTAKTFDGVSCKPCSRKEMNKVERFFIEALLPKYNRCSFSECIRRIWVGHMAERPMPNRTVNPETAAQMLGVTLKQLCLLQRHGLTCHKKRIPRMNARRRFYFVRELHQFTAQNAEAIQAAKLECPA